MATVTKHFRIKSGLIVEGNTGTIGGQNILTETGGDQYILNLVGGATLVKSVDTGVFNVDNAGNLTINANTFDSYGSAADAESNANIFAQGAADAAEAAAVVTANAYTDVAEGREQTNRNNAITNAITDLNLPNTYDAKGAAATAEQNAKDYADSKISDTTAATDKSWSGYKTNTEIGLAEQRAKDHADDAVAGLVGSAPAVLDTIQELATALENNPDIIADLENVAAGKQNTLTAGENIDITDDVISVTGLNSQDISDFNTAAVFATNGVYDVAGAASAVADNLGDHINDSSAHGVYGDVVGTTDVQDLSNKRIIDALQFSDGQTIANEAEIGVEAVSHRFNVVAKAGDLVLGSLFNDVVIAPNSANAYLGTPDSDTKIATIGDVNSAASDAQSDAEATAQAALNNVLDGTTAFTEINVNDEVKQIAATSTIATAITSTVYSWPKADYRSGKFLVKIDNGTHNEVSEILVTLDSSDNVAITEYAIVGTNGSRGTISAAIAGSNVAITVLPTSGSTVKVTGTLIK